MTTRIVAGNDSAFSLVRLKYGSNPTDTVTGVIIYPDDFTFSEAGVGALNFGAYPVTQIDAVTWEALEDVGCVFLPVERGVWLSDLGTQNTLEEQWGMISIYWAASATNSAKAVTQRWDVGGRNVMPKYDGDKSLRVGVRLVQDYK